MLSYSKAQRAGPRDNEHLQMFAIYCKTSRLDGYEMIIPNLINFWFQIIDSTVYSNLVALAGSRIDLYYK